MIKLKELEVWFVTGSQDLYGPKVLQQVAANSKEIAAFFNDSAKIPVSIVHKSVMRSPDEITSVCIEANSDSKCIGVVTYTTYYTSLP